jgi:hypothetical protein
MRPALISASVPGMPRRFSCETRKLCTGDSPWSAAWWQVVVGSIAHFFSEAVGAGGAVAVLPSEDGTTCRVAGNRSAFTCFLLSLSASLAPERVSRRHPVIVISPIPGIPRSRAARTVPTVRRLTQQARRWTRKARYCASSPVPATSAARQNVMVIRRVRRGRARARSRVGTALPGADRRRRQQRDEHEDHGHPCW